jgi:hypothetical protein
LPFKRLTRHGFLRSLAESTGNVILGLLVFRIGEYLGGRPIFHQDTGTALGTINHHKNSEVRNASGLLHIMRDNYNRIRLF